MADLQVDITLIEMSETEQEMLARRARIQAILRRHMHELLTPEQDTLTLEEKTREGVNGRA